MKLQTILAASLVLLATCALKCAADEQTPFDRANAEFAQKDFGRAASAFQAIIARQGFSAPVLFNLANAYYDDGKIGLAILNYERAQLLAPRDTDIAFNLQVARVKEGLADRPTSWLDQVARFLSLNTLSGLGSAAVVLIAAGVVLRRFGRRNRFAWRAGMAASCCVLVATMLAVGIRWPELNQAIVIVKNTPVYISPVTVGQPLYTLGEGQTVAMQNPHGEFVLIETSDGHRGWVKLSDVRPLIPATHAAWIAFT
jgi:tetratricopeptide (TPR) repeat protein